MSKYKKPKVGFLDHVAGKQNDPTLDDLVKNVQESSDSVKKSEPIVEKKEEQKQTPIVEEKKPVAPPVDPTMGSYIKATQNDPTSVKGSFDKKVTEGYVPPVREEKKPDALKAEKVSAYQKALQEREARSQKLKEAANLLSGEDDRPVTRQELNQIKTSLASMGEGGVGYAEAVNIAKKYAAPLDSDQNVQLEFFLEHFDSVADLLNAATDYETPDFDSDFATKTTNDLPEPSVIVFGDSGTNRYFTEERARASIQSIDSAVQYDQVTGNIALNTNFISTYNSDDFDSDLASKNTDDLTEGSTNRYYHDSFVEALVDSAYVNARVDLPDTQILSTTDSLSEGVTNLYYTDDRARSAISSGDSYIQYDSTTGEITFDASVIPEGYTSENFDSDFLTKNTDSLAEGSSNLYYTTARFDSDASGINSKLDSLEDRLDSDDIEIQTLKNKFDQLDLSSALQIQYNKILSYDSTTDSIPVGSYGLHFDGAGTEYNNVDKLFLHHTDRKGIHVPLGTIDSNDTIIITDSDGGVGRYQIDAFEDRGNHHKFDVSVQAGQGAPADLAAIKIFPEQNLNALASMDYVDAQDKILQNQINTLDSALDSQDARNVAEHQGFTDRLDSAYAWNVAEHSALQSNLDSDIASEHAWNVAEHEKEITARQNADSDLDSDISTKVSKSGDTMTGDLTLVDPHRLSANVIGGVGNSNLNIRRWNDTKIQITSTANKNFQKITFNSDYGVNDPLDVPHKMYVDTAIDSAIANASFVFDSSQFVDATGDQMTGELAISRPEGSIALKINKQDQDRIRFRTDGRINWTGNATDARLNKDGGNFTISLNNNTYMKFDLSQGDIEVAKTLTLTGTEKVINLPNNSDTGELQSNGNRRLFWDQNNVGIDVGLNMSGQVNMDGDGTGRNKIINLATPTSDYHAANKKYVDDNMGANAFIKNGGTTTLTETTHILAGSSGKWLNIQAATNSGTGFFVMRNYEGDTNLFQVNGDGTVKLSAGRMATDLDEVTTKRYVDAKVDGGSGVLAPGRRFKFISYAQGSTVPEGHFSPYTSDKSPENLFINRTDLDGMRLAEGAPDFTPGLAMPITIYKFESNTWKSVGFGHWGTSRTDYHTSYMAIMTTWKQRPTLTSGQIYAIVIGGKW